MSKDIGIVIALEEEFEVFLKCFALDEECSPKLELDQATGEYFCEFTYSVDDATYRCVAIKIGEMGNIDSALCTAQMIYKWKPRNLVMIGIAGGIDKDVKVGDVVFAAQIDLYLDRAKALDSKTGFHFEFGSRVYPCSENILNHIRNFKLSNPAMYKQWTDSCLSELRLEMADDSYFSLVEQKLIQESPHYFDGCVASSEIVSSSPNFKKILLAQNRNFRAVEMEAGGFIRACRRINKSQNRDFIVIRGISDYGDERKKELDQIQSGVLRRYAMRNAVNIFMKLLDSKIFDFQN